MSVTEMLFYTGFSFLFLTTVFRPLEIAFPAKPNQSFFRPSWLTDLCFFLGQYLFWNGLVLITLTDLGDWLDAIVPTGFRQNVAAQPTWVQIAEVIVLSDLLIYWAHRLQHSVNFLWRFHAVHHSSEHLDWLSAHREHPLDTIYTMGVLNLPAFILGFDLNAIIGFITFRGVWAIYIHSNVRLPIGPLKILLGAPELHHWHHDCARDAGNYANVSPLMDVLFGTYHCPDHEPERFGLAEPGSKSYWNYMIQPLLPRRRRQTANSDELLNREIILAHTSGPTLLQGALQVNVTSSSDSYPLPTPGHLALSHEP